MTQDSNNVISISLYREGELTKEVLMQATGDILRAFPKLENGMLDLLRERFKAKGFTDQRVMDSIYHVIDSYKGFDKLPAIGDFISFDKRCKLLTQDDLEEMTVNYSNESRGKAFDDHPQVDIGGKIMRARAEDVKTYKLKLWESKKR